MLFSLQWKGRKCQRKFKERASINRKGDGIGNSGILSYRTVLGRLEIKVLGILEKFQIHTLSGTKASHKIVRPKARGHVTDLKASISSQESTSNSSKPRSRPRYFGSRQTITRCSFYRQLSCSRYTWLSSWWTSAYQ